MPNYPNLPGSNVRVTDGGLRAAVTFANKPTLVLGTSAQGPADRPVQVTDSAVTANLFGLQGTLARGMAEVLMHSDNVLVWRLGTKPATLTGVGTSTAEDGLKITFGQRQSNAGQIYKIWYSNGCLYIWLNGNLVYANDPVNQVSEDSGDTIVDGQAEAGLNLCVQNGLAFQEEHEYVVGDLVRPTTYNGFNYVCTVAGAAAAAEPEWGVVLNGITTSGTASFKATFPSTPSVDNALSIVQAAAVAPVGQLSPPIFVAAVDGTGLSGRETYIALDEALYLLSTQQVAQIYCPNVVLDNPNVAFYVSADATTAIHNPATNPNALDWLKTETDIYGTRTYTWASDSAEEFESAQDRIEKGFYEVNFGYLLARFAASQQEELGGCVSFIGTNGPAYYNGRTLNRFDLLSTLKFVGALPKYDLNGNPASFGVGICGIPYLTGTTSTKLNPLTLDFQSGFRLPGFFENDADEYDGGANLDKNGNKIDIGQYLHVVYDYQQMGNSYSSRYVGNLAGVVAGKSATLDQKQALTYKQLSGVTQIWFPNFPQMDALAKAKANGLRGDEGTPTLIHDNTAALSTSDWFTLYNVNLRFMLTNIAFTRGKTFLGTGSLDGLQSTALTTALDADATVLQKRGYINYASFKVTTTAADARIGQAAVDVQFSAPGQLRRLNFSVGINQSVQTI